MTNLMHVALHVVTALQDGTFGEVFNAEARQLRQGDQMVRWYIPASLIPMRHFDGTARNDAHPIRVTYTVGLDVARIAEEGISADYRNRHRLPDLGNAGYPHTYYFYANHYWYKTGETIEHHNVTLAFYQPHERNPFYQASILGPRDAVMKSSNPTDTAAHVTYPTFTLAGRLNEHWLGNNGRLTVRWEPSRLLITKDFAFYEHDNAPMDSSLWPSVPDDFVTPLIFTISGPDGFKPMTITFPGTAPDPVFVFNNDENRWELLLEDLPPGTYVITESGGHIGGFSPGAALTTVDVEYILAGTQGEANFTNRYRRIDYDSALVVRKFFNGLTEAEVATLLPDF